ncbi:MAG: hypothetical protein PSV22_23920 [Pseudolabrys sp.]|nr:hypothetical protein [Pseudolabrys sp.]
MATDILGNWINPDTKRSSLGLSKPSYGASNVSNLAGAVGDILGGQATGRGLKLKAQGDLAEATNYDLASILAAQNSEFTKQSTAVKEMQTERETYLGLGRTEADVAGAGFQMSGSGLDILRMGAAQGALTHQIVGQQGLITEAGFDEQSKAYSTMATTARYAASEEESMAGDAERNGWITGGIKAAAGIASLFIGSGF